MTPHECLVARRNVDFLIGHGIIDLEERNRFYTRITDLRDKEEVELSSCSRCNKPFKVEIKEQVICDNRNCILAED